MGLRDTEVGSAMWEEGGMSRRYSLRRRKRVERRWGFVHSLGGRRGGGMSVGKGSWCRYNLVGLLFFEGARVSDWKGVCVMMVPFFRGEGENWRACVRK